MNIVEHPFEAVAFDAENWSIRPFRAGDLDRFEELACEVLRILSDEKTLYFIPEKGLRSMAEATAWLQRAVLNFHTGRSFIHFIRQKKDGRLIGMVDILAPDLVKEYYLLADYPYFIEFYLAGSAQGRLLMSEVLPQIIQELQHKGIKKIAAVVNRKNKASKRVLEKAGFSYGLRFDPVQDLYEMVEGMIVEGNSFSYQRSII